MSKKSKEPTFADIANQFHMYVGYCVTAWAQIEDEIFTICKFSLGATIERTAIVFHRTPTLDSRLQLTTDLINTVIIDQNHPDLAQWAKLIKKCKALMEVRNRIAHERVNQRVKDAKNIQPSETWFEIYASGHKRIGKKSSAQSIPLTVDDLIQHQREVGDLKSLFYEFFSALSKHIQAPPEQEPLPK